MYVSNMTSKVPRNTKPKFLVASLVTENRAPCVFCQRLADDELIYGKLYAIGNIQCHYFCVLLSCCLIQKGKDEEGLFGFMYADILAEVERSKKHRCSFCGKGGATLGCSISQCRKQFHLPCGRERNAVSLYFGNYKSFCELHAPRQKIPEHIMANARIRKKHAKRKSDVQNPKAPQKLSCLKELNESPAKDDISADAALVESVCVICYEPVEGFPTPRTFWPPCCARDAWFHRTCLQRMALSAGIHYLKCPLCNDKENFYDALADQGYYVPDRDAAWELEQNAFAEIYERPLLCSAAKCKCPNGKKYDAETGEWDMKLCILCGTSGMHAGCLPSEDRFVCATCKPAAPSDLETLAVKIEAVIQAEQARSARSERRGPVMPSRMSLRRTKQRVAPNAPSTSRGNNSIKTETNDQATDTECSRLELNLKTPKRQREFQNSVQKFQPTILKDVENTLLSPLKLVEQGLRERLQRLGVKEIDINRSKVLEKVREKFKKPRPLSAKKRIVNKILESLLDNPKTVAVMEWSSPEKCVDTSPNTQMHSQENKSPLIINFSPRKDSMNSKLSLKRNAPINAMSTATTKDKDPKENTEKGSNEGVQDQKKDTENESNDLIDKIVTANDAAPSNRRSIEEACKNNITPIKEENGKEICDKEDSTTKTIGKGSNESIHKALEDTTPLKRDSINEAYKNDFTATKQENSNIFVRENSTTNIIEKESSESGNSTPQKDNNSKEISDKRDTTPSKRGSIKEDYKNFITPTKKEISEQICNREDSSTKTLCKESSESDNSTSAKETKSNEINDDKGCVADGTLHDHSSNSTFVQPLEFLADCNSDESLLLFKTPKTLKTVDIQKDSSLEICENDEVVNISHIKVEPNAEKSEFLKNLNLIGPVKTKKCAYKFSEKDKETLEEKKMDIDLESFKNYYLNEVDREFKCNFGHKHKVAEENDGRTPIKLRTAIDYAIEAFMKKSDNECDKNLKRKTSDAEGGPEQKKKKEDHKRPSPKVKIVYKPKKKGKRGTRKIKKKNSTVQIKNKKEASNTNIQVVCASETGGEEKDMTETIDLRIEAGPKRKNNKVKKKNKHKKMLKQNIQVKIRFKKERLRLKITKSQNKKPKNNKREKSLQQCVLKFAPDNSKISPKTVVVKPEHPLTPLKRKYNLKQEKSPDNLVQTSIHSFFKVKPSH